MIVIIFSDSHGSFELLDNILNKYNPERVFGLGDFEVDIYELDKRNIRGVRGNSYRDPELEDDLYFSIFNFNFHITHGHKYGVKYSLDQIYKDAINRNIDITFYGHTHEARIKEINNRLFVNPGSITIPIHPSEETFALMDINENKVNIKIIGALSYDIYDETEVKK